jgi:hypothetical protein
MEVGIVFFYMDDILCDLKVFFDIDDADEELSSTQFFRLVTRLPAYNGAVRRKLEVYAQEHEDELKRDRETAMQPAPVTLTPDQLRNSPRLGAAPAAGQSAPIFNTAVY